MDKTSLIYDLVVVGAGAGGLAAALAASRMGVKTLLIERGPEIGGTAVLAGVSCWEPSIGGRGIPEEIYRRLCDIPNAVGIYTIRDHMVWPKPRKPVFPGALIKMDPAMDYSDTLRRHGSAGIADDEEFARRYWHGVQTEPAEYAKVLRTMLAETKCCDIFTDSIITCIKAAQKRVETIEFSRAGKKYIASAQNFIDSTAESSICSLLGCEMMFGAEGRDVFDEPDAPENSTADTNGISLIYRITKDSSKWLKDLPDTPGDCWWRPSFPPASIVEYPNGDYNVNSLPTMEGSEFRSMAYDDAYSECICRIVAHWRYTQDAWKDFGDYGISWIAPKLGVREGPRVVGEYVLTEHDLLAGMHRQPHEDIVAITDHAIDIHGSHARVAGRRGGEVKTPYGIPFRCLIPRGWQNFLAASRGASFSHIANSSCRLTRTIMRLGQAAGTAVGIAQREGCYPREISRKALRSELSRHGADDLP